MLSPLVFFIVVGDAQAGQAGEKIIIDLPGALRETIGKIHHICEQVFGL